MGNVCVSVMFIRACVCMPQLNRKLQTAIDLKDRQLEEMQVSLRRALEQLKDKTVEEPADAAHGAKVGYYGW